MEQHNSNKRFFFGIILIVVGIILILEKMGWISDSASDLLISWQMLLIVIGGLSLIGGSRTSGTILVVIGSIFLLPELFSISEEMRQLTWPLILVAIGAALLMRQIDHRRLRFGRRSTDPTLQDIPFNSPDGNPTGSSADSFDDFVIFGGREIFINSPALSGGKATSIFGGIEFDLRKASLQPGGAVIDCVSVFGGCGFKIPMDWNVRNEVTTIFGAFTDKRGDTYSDRYYDPSKTILIKGVSIFGGIEVKHF